MVQSHDLHESSQCVHKLFNHHKWEKQNKKNLLKDVQKPGQNNKYADEK
jgi:hypothetical protein